MRRPQPPPVARVPILVPTKHASKTTPQDGKLSQGGLQFLTDDFHGHLSTVGRAFPKRNAYPHAASIGLPLGTGGVHGDVRPGQQVVQPTIRFVAGRGHGDFRRTGVELGPHVIDQVRHPKQRFHGAGRVVQRRGDFPTGPSLVAVCLGGEVAMGVGAVVAEGHVWVGVFGVDGDGRDVVVFARVAVHQCSQAHHKIVPPLHHRHATGTARVAGATGRRLFQINVHPVQHDTGTKWPPSLVCVCGAVLGRV